MQIFSVIMNTASKIVLLGPNATTTLYMTHGLLYVTWI